MIIFLFNLIFHARMTNYKAILKNFIWVAEWWWSFNNICIVQCDNSCKSSKQGICICHGNVKTQPSRGIKPGIFKHWKMVWRNFFCIHFCNPYFPGFVIYLWNWKIRSGNEWLNLVTQNFCNFSEMMTLSILKGILKA